jgi:hypothetical protein
VKTGVKMLKRGEKWARNGQNRLKKLVIEIKVAQGM